MSRILRQLFFVVAAFTCTSVWAIQQGAGSSPNGGTLDTSFAVEYSNSCLNGCHSANQPLVDQYSQSLMTHTMVKCNACHGTHTAVEVGKPKPNITGYHTGMGATGYIVGKDRCLVCHSAIDANARHPNRPCECVSCHAPHIFPVNR